ncbi:MAG TPA: amino acid adenylation domain-containing protein, partial [Pyrinomonadaceae bacterium]
MVNKVIEGFRLSPQQERVWRLIQQDGAARYCARCALMLDGELDVHTLQLAVQEVVARHEILRTRLDFIQGMELPLQVIDENVNVTIEINDQTARIEELFTAPNSEQLEARLLQLAPKKHLLFFSLPAFCADGPSLRNLMKDLGESYKARTGAGAVEEEPMQYADYAGWQSDLLESSEAEAGKLYWRKRNLSETAALKLPFERSASSTTAWITCSGEQRIEFATIEALALRYNVPVSTVLLAALYVLLWRLTGQSDLLISVAYDGRRYEELSSVIGPIAKYLPLACAVDDIGFPQFVERVQEVIREARQWQEVFTYESDESALMPFAFEYVERAEPYRIGDLQFSMYREDVRLDRFKVKLSCEREADVLKLQFHFDENYYDTTAISNLSSQYRTLLNSLAAQPEAGIAQLNLLSEAERHLALVEWNDTSATYSLDRCLHELFEDQAQRTPDHIAVVYQDQKLTYAELNARANQLAHDLRSRGVGTETLAGVMMERSLEMVVALLGVLKAGGAYLPLDTDYPRERLAFMLADAEVHCLLTETHLQAELEDPPCEVICLDAEWEKIAGQSDRNPVSDVSAGNLAYVIYTSGSAGKPKGVTVTHGNVMRLFAATDDWFHFDERDVWTLFHSYAFDFSVWELWGALLYGGRLVVVPYLVSRSPEVFHQLLVKEQVTVLNQTPSAFYQLIHAEETADLALRLLIFGGEALKIQSLKPWFDRHGDQKPLLVNMYGITETTVHVTYHPLSIADVNGGSVIGRPISDLQVYVLDAYMQPVPVGVAGEMYVGGDGVARGYLRQPALTATRFAPHPFSTKPGARLYRTGDLARYLITGELEYLGRIDHQVKIRGFRIELGEIEAVLLTHSGVREAVVMAREDSPGEKRLAAYLILEHTNSISELRGFLKERLPDYMIPSAFVVLDKLPLSSNGKVDRRRLPEPETSRPSLTDTYVPPATEAERVLAHIWSEVLQVKQVGIHDNFFELGGDSILSVQIITRARRAGLQLTAKQVFNRQTIAELAAVAGSAPQSQATQGEVTGAVELTPAQLQFFEQQLAEPQHWNMARMIALAEEI